MDYNFYSLETYSSVIELPDGRVLYCSANGGMTIMATITPPQEDLSGEPMM